MTAPELDPAANRLPLATAEAAALAERRFEIAPDVAGPRGFDRRSAPDRLRHADRRRGTGPGPLRRGPARRRRGHRLGADPGDRGQRRIRRVNPPALAALFAVVLVVVIAGYIVVASYNAIVALRQRIDKAWANIDVVLKQRHDQLPNLVAAVRGLMTFERDVLTEVTRARAAYSPTAPIPDQAATSDATSQAVRSLFAVVERYPDLKSQGNVQDLQDEIERLEAMIADRRELYNDQVYRYNTTIGQVPGILLASVLGWKARQFFAADRPTRRVPTPTSGRRDPARRRLEPDRRPLAGPSRRDRMGPPRSAYRADRRPVDRPRARAGPGARPAAGRPSVRARADQSRCREPARPPALAGFGEVARPDPDLLEWDYGALEGRRDRRHPGDRTRAGRSGADRGPAARRSPRSRRGPIGSWPGSGPAGTAADAPRLCARTPAPGAGRPLARPRAGVRAGSSRWRTGTISVLGWEHGSPVVQAWNEACQAGVEG